MATRPGLGWDRWNIPDQETPTMATNHFVARAAAAERLCAALGLDGHKVTSLTITFEQHGAVTAHATIPVDWDAADIDLDAFDDYVANADGLTVTTEQSEPSS